MPKFQQHIKSTFGRPQSLETLVNQLNGHGFYVFDFHVEKSDQISPVDLVSRLKRVELALTDGLGELVYFVNHVVDSLWLAGHCF